MFPLFPLMKKQWEKNMLIISVVPAVSTVPGQNQQARVKRLLLLMATSAILRPLLVPLLLHGYEA